MRVTRLKLANVRAIKAAEFHFLPGFNLVAGVNGVGKTTVLDALAACLAEFVSNNVNVPLHPTLLAKPDDVRAGTEALDVECELEYGGATFTYSHHKSLSGPPYGPNSLHTGGQPPDFGDEPESAAVAVLFATNRAVASRKVSPKSAAVGGKAAAVAGAFVARELRLAECAAWIRARQVLGQEQPASKRVLRILDETVARFLPGYRNVRVEEDSGWDLMVEHGGATFSVRQLSDGERGILALVLDLTRRLALAYPEQRNPAGESEAVVLIDEIELHLHPKWQRQIVRNLTAAFPRCQFIATTHSPQVIGEVEHDRIHIVTEDGVYSPSHSFGVDSSRVLEEIMDTEPRSTDVAELIARISRDTQRKLFRNARQDLERLVDRLGENDPEVTHLHTFLDLMEGDE